MHKHIIKISRQKAIEITISHNGVTREMAERYTDSELKEVLAHASGTTFKYIGDF